jgi:hypothetical protein
MRMEVLRGERQISVRCKGMRGAGLRLGKYLHCRETVLVGIITHVTTPTNDHKLASIHHGQSL